MSGAPRNLPITTMPSKAHKGYLKEHGTWIGVHVKSLAKVSLLRRTAQGCTVATWKFSTREPSVTKPAHLVYKSCARVR